MRVFHLLTGLSVAMALGVSSHAQWSLSGTKIFYNAGNVGIGTSNPTYKLDVRAASGRAVFGWVAAASGATYGVYGQSSSTGGRGVMGFANASTGATSGVYGQSASKTGFGVFGFASSATGTPVGVFGQCTSPTGRGVYALSNSGTGVGYGVYAKANSPAAYAGYFIGARNYFSGNVGIGTETPQDKLHVNGITRTKTLKIVGGADLAEPFDISDEDGTPLPGMVVAIDAANAGKLRVAGKAYDRTVAGVISGANGLSPGLVMRAEGNPQGDGEHPVALTGRVWCWCDATLGAIEPGDLLTTSETPGHAMKVNDLDKARGAIIGKAMTRLEQDRGMVLVLISLQ